MIGDRTFMNIGLVRVGLSLSGSGEINLCADTMRTMGVGHPHEVDNRNRVSKGIKNEFL